ncbi:MAG: hypothetical protein HY331_00390 [Chloroflexi bacterium]|nr:hypothetical protein [Chloroflexota bacterium]
MKFYRVTLSCLMVLAVLLSACAPAPAAQTPAKPAAAPVATAPAQPTASQPAAAATTAPAQPAAATAPSQPAAPTAAAAAPVATKPAAKPQGSIVVAHFTGPDTADFTLDTGKPFHAEWMRNVAETLVFKVKNTPQIVPGLAERWERVEPTIWRFFLRKGVQFHNGQRFDADSVVWSIQREINPDLRSSALSYLATIAEIRKVDDFTVDVVTKGPDAIVPTRMFYAPILAAGQSNEQLATKPIGTGPYKWVEWVRGQYILWTANESYWGPMPKIKDVRFVARTESRTRAAMIQTGEADLAHLLSPEDVAVLGEKKSLSHPSLELAFVRFGTQNPVVQDIRVRRALVMAIDYDSIAKSLFGGFATPATGAQVITPLALGFNKDIRQYSYNLDEAKRLIQEAGARGAKLTLFTRAGFFPRVEELGEFLTTSWRAIGLNVEFRILDSAEFGKKIYAVRPEDGPADMILGKHDNDLYDSSKSAEGYLACGGRLSTVCEPEMDKLVKQAGSAAGEDRASFYRQAWARAQELIPWVGIVNFQVSYGKTERINWEGGAPIDDKINLLDLSIK